MRINVNAITKFHYVKKVDADFGSWFLSGRPPLFSHEEICVPMAA
jgi:hypothetical protein